MLPIAYVDEVFNRLYRILQCHYTPFPLKLVKIVTEIVQGLGVFQEGENPSRDAEGRAGVEDTAEESSRSPNPPFQLEIGCACSHHESNWGWLQARGITIQSICQHRGYK